MTWPQVPLGELCDVLDSQRKPVTKRDRLAGKYPYYGATGILDYVAEYIFDEKLVLIGEDGAKWGAGEKTAFAANGKYWVNNHAHVVRPLRDRVLDDWIIYYLNFSDLSKFITGLTVPKLNQGKLCEIPVPLPSLLEQQRIVAILDEAFAGLATATANAEKNLKNARELFESYLQSIFDQNKSLGFPTVDGAKEPTNWQGAQKIDNSDSTRTGGRAATTRHIEGRRSLCVGLPKSKARDGWAWRALDGLGRMESGHTPSRRHPEYFIFALLAQGSAMTSTANQRLSATAPPHFETQSRQKQHRKINA